jgi:hypothetical protein
MTRLALVLSIVLSTSAFAIDLLPGNLEASIVKLGAKELGLIEREMVQALESQLIHGLNFKAGFQGLKALETKNPALYRELEESLIRFGVKKFNFSKQKGLTQKAYKTAAVGESKALFEDLAAHAGNWRTKQVENLGFAKAVGKERARKFVSRINAIVGKNNKLKPDVHTFAKNFNAKGFPADDVMKMTEIQALSARKNNKLLMVKEACEGYTAEISGFMKSWLQNKYLAFVGSAKTAKDEVKASIVAFQKMGLDKVEAAHRTMKTNTKIEYACIRANSGFKKVPAKGCGVQYINSAALCL